MPKVSVITPTHNRETTIRRAIESIEKQTYSDFEHIVVDDGSTDSTKDIIEEYTAGDVSLIEFSENKGANTARNAGIKAASGKYIAFLDSDDEYLPRRLESTVKKIENQPASCAGVYHSYRVIGDGTIRNIWNAKDGLIDLSTIADENVIGGFSATMFRREIFEKIGYLDEDIPSSQDYEFYLRVLNEYYMVGLSKVLANYYTSSDAISSNINRRQKAHDYLIEKHGDIISNKRKSNQQYAIATLKAKNGNMEGARAELVGAIQLYPWRGVYYYHYVSTLFGKTAFEYADQIKTWVKLLIENRLPQRIS